MVKKKFEMMAEYVLPRLEAGGQKFEQGQSKLEGIGVINYLRSDDKTKRIFLIERVFTEKEYKLLQNITSGRTPYRGHTVNYDHASIFFKDGKMYFRSASFGDKAGLKGVKYKQTKDLSLKDYNDDEVSRMMLLTPAELFGLKRDNNIWYFQPSSEKLKEALVKYRFTPVRFNYSHLDNYAKFKPENKDSKRIYINKLVEELSDSIRLERGQLINSDLPPKSYQRRLF